MSTAIDDTKKIIDEVLEAYPEKVRKARVRHLAPNDPEGGCATCKIQKSNIKSRPVL
jgi:nitrogenase molybdenum-iron protein alpha chain